MKAHIDPVKCDGFGACHDILPAVFLVDEWGYAYTQGDGEVSTGEEHLARQAAIKCPVNAVVLHAEDSEATRPSESAASS